MQELLEPPKLPAQARWKNRIVGYGHANPVDLKPNPAALRIHTQAALDSLGLALDRQIFGKFY